jgi:hypothetical protein
MAKKNATDKRFPTYCELTDPAGQSCHHQDTRWRRGSEWPTISEEQKEAIRAVIELWNPLYRATGREAARGEYDSLVAKIVNAIERGMSEPPLRNASRRRK